MIQKNIIGTLEIDPSSNKIWLNTIEGKCVLRVSGIEFKNIIQKFEQIDINKDSVYLLGTNPHDDQSHDLTAFMFKCISLFLNIDRSFEYEELYKYIEKYFDEEGDVNAE